MGSLARSLLVDGLRWRWIAEDPGVRRRSLLGDLILERNRIVVAIEAADLLCPNLPRWLMPIPDVADLTGHSFSWLDAPPMPSEDELLRELLEHPQEVGSSSDADAQSLASSLLDIAGIRAVTEVLAYAGHGNFLGQQSTLAEDGAAGWDLRADYEALVLNAAAVGATVTLLGSAEAVPEAWPTDVERQPFVQTAVALAKAVSEAAVAVHGLVAPNVTQRTLGSERGRPPAAPIIRPQAVLSPGDHLLGEPSTTALEETFSRAESFYALATSMPVNPWGQGPPTLHEALAYGGGLSNLETLMVTYEQAGGEVMAVFAARILLEESARLHWRFAVGDDEETFKARAKQFFDEWRARRRRTIAALVNAGVPYATATGLFRLPGNVVMASGPDDIAKGRVPIPSLTQLLADLGGGYREPGWLQAAYSMLSQVVHSTSVGQLHTIREVDGLWQGNSLSHEMLALSLDVGCLGAAILIGHSTLILTDLSDEAKEFYVGLRQAALRVHETARVVHGLD